ncbi:unnamed protein product [Prorocentrum cordatum]|uniref:Uncharacterized protein n=1 Tax=Prorocentrum cordatum TaxID=2364126 RepID=A0ABN9RSI6_9DINO|nr:unnamed protein product [Polarella glacialis]
MAAIPLGASLLQGDLLDGVVESALRSVAAQLKAEFRRELGLALRVAQPEAALGLGFERTEAPLVAVPGLNTPVTEHAEGKTGEPTEPKMADRCGLHAMPQRMASFGDATKPAENAQARPVLTEEDQAEIIRMRAEEIAREEAAKKAMRRHRLHSVMFDQPILGQASRCKVFLYHLITSLKFDLCMGVIILLNAISIGLETSTSRRGDHVPFFLHALEYMFLSLLRGAGHPGLRRRARGVPEPLGEV